MAQQNESQLALCNAIRNSIFPMLLDSCVEQIIIKLEAEYINTFGLDKEYEIAFLRSKNQLLLGQSEINLNGREQLFSLPIKYNSHRFGLLIICTKQNAADSGCFQDIAANISTLLYRELLNRLLSTSRFSSPNQYWLGKSPAIRQLEKAIDKMSCVDFPILICGDSGTGKRIAAHSIHCLSYRYQKPFLETSCYDWDSSNTVSIMQKLISSARGGTLLLKNINAVSEQDFCQIKHYWNNGGNQEPSSVRILSTINTDKSNVVPAHLNKLSCLTLPLPTLTERKEDIKPLIEFYIQKYQHINRLQLDNDAWHALSNHPWPENAKSLEACIAQLAVMSESNIVSRKDIDEFFERFHLPCKNREHNSDRISDLCLSNSKKFPNNNRAVKDYKECSAALAKKLLAGEMQQDADLHPALKKALLFLMENYKQKISVEDVANIVYISPSHLSYLFRVQLNVSFKQLLLNLRVERAKTLLAQVPRLQITSISSDVGFRDLSHFEKTFKKNTGMTPKKYRIQLNSGP